MRHSPAQLAAVDTLTAAPEGTVMRNLVITNVAPDVGVYRALQDRATGTCRSEMYRVGPDGGIRPV